MRIVSEKFLENVRTHVLCSITYFSKIMLFFLDNVQKCCRAGQATDDSMAHAHCMLDT